MFHFLTILTCDSTFYKIWSFHGRVACAAVIVKVCKCQSSLLTLSCFLLAPSRFKTWVQLPNAQYCAIRCRLIVVAFRINRFRRIVSYCLLSPGARQVSQGTDCIEVKWFGHPVQGHWVLFSVHWKLGRAGCKTGHLSVNHLRDLMPLARRRRPQVRTRRAPRSCA